MREVDRGDVGARVARVADAVAVRVGLGRIGYVRAVVDRIRHAVAVHVSASARVRGGIGRVRARIELVAIEVSVLVAIDPDPHPGSQRYDGEGDLAAARRRLTETARALRFRLAVRLELPRAEIEPAARETAGDALGDQGNDSRVRERGHRREAIDDGLRVLVAAHGELDPDRRVRVGREAHEIRLEVVPLGVSGGSGGKAELRALEIAEDRVGASVVREAEAAIVQYRPEREPDLLVKSAELRNVERLRFADDVRRDEDGSGTVRKRMARRTGRRSDQRNAGE